MTTGDEIIGENYEWHKNTSEIVHKITRFARPESDYTAKVDVYEDRVIGWFFDIVHQHVNPHTGPGDYIAVMVVCGYIEGVEQYRNGEETPSGESGKWFRNSTRRIFPGVSKVAIDRLWKDVRNGMFHDGFTKGPTLLSHDYDSPITIQGKYLKINPLLLLRHVMKDFERYVEDLRKDGDGILGQNFSKHWNERWENT